jgi:flavorubredoxin
MDPHFGEKSGTLPRLITPTLLWTGGCVEYPYQGQMVHTHMSAFLVKGSAKTVLIDTGNPYHTRETFEAVETFLEGRPLDYIFVTHTEFPHAGLLPNWMERYPKAIAFGDLGEIEFTYPEFADRVRIVKPGDKLDLGDRELIILPGVWHDLPSTLWGYDTKDEVLFVSDAFCYLHYHESGHCDLLSSEQPLPEAHMVNYYNGRTMKWTQFTDARITFNDIDRLIGMFKPKIIASAHGTVIDTPQDMVPMVKDGMLVGTLQKL